MPAETATLGVEDVRPCALARAEPRVTLVELKDIQLPDSMKRATARRAEAEREKRAKIINAEGEAMAAASLRRRALNRCGAG